MPTPNPQPNLQPNPLSVTMEHQVILTVGGPQLTAVTTHTRRPGDGRPAVQVSYASVLTICHDPGAVGRRARAWQRGLTLARQGHLPASPGYRTGQDPLRGSAALIAHLGPEPVQTTAHGAGNALRGEADVIVRVGNLSVRCLDLDAVASIADAWQDADRLARVLWGAEAIATRPQL